MEKKDKIDFNLDFLDKEKKIGTVSAPIDSAKVKFFQYFKECLTNFPKFAKDHLLAPSPNFLLLVIWVLGIGNAADRLTSSNSSTWGEVWAVAIFGGILVGAIAYYIGGWFYHVRVGWSKGRGSIDTARNIYIFSSLPISLISIGSLFFNMIAYGSDYFDSYYAEASIVDIIFGLLAIAAIGYSIYISYRAVRETMYVEKSRAIGWFVVAPVIFYILVLISAGLK
jgi:hypothetical protein